MVGRLGPLEPRELVAYLKRKVWGVQETRWYRELGPFVLVSEGPYLFSAYGRYMIRSVCKQVRSKTEEVKRFE